MTNKKQAEAQWNIEDTIENLKKLKIILMNRLLKLNFEGHGNSDYKEVELDFNRAIEALEKQTPKEPRLDGDSYDSDGDFIWNNWLCPNCESRYDVDYDDYNFCPNCGQRIDWR